MSGDICYKCKGLLEEEDLYVFKLSTMTHPWCNMCVKEEDARILSDRDPEDPPGFYRSLPDYLLN